MLVLSRKIGESIKIADDIRITVTEVKGGRVRLSIEAPDSVRVLRKEIADAIGQKDDPDNESPAKPKSGDDSVN